MAKLDELLEILTEEMEGFKSSIKQIKQISNQLNNSEIQRDLSSINHKQSELKRTQERYFEVQRENILELRQKVKQAKLVPKWLLILSCITFFSALLVSTYAIYEVRDSWDKQVIAYNKGKEIVTDEYDEFFKDNTQAYGQYLKWREQQDEIERKSSKK